MNFQGHGVDLVSIKSFQNLLSLSELDFLSRVFQECELHELPVGVNRLETIAGRFAAKEAVIKALGTGFGDGIAFTDIIIHREPKFRPQVKMTGGASVVASRLGITDILLSISHTDEMAIASAIAIRE